MNGRRDGSTPGCRSTATSRADGVDWVFIVNTRVGIADADMEHLCRSSQRVARRLAGNAPAPKPDQESEEQESEENVEKDLRARLRSRALAAPFFSRPVRESRREETGTCGR